MTNLKITKQLILTAGLLACSLTAAEHSKEELIKLVQVKGCASCHGTKGQGNSYMKGPKLAGQPSSTLIQKIKDYRGGINKNPTMAVMSAHLTDDEINQLAEYFSQFK